MGPGGHEVGTAPSLGHGSSEPPKPREKSTIITVIPSTQKSASAATFLSAVIFFMKASGAAKRSS